MKTIGAVGMVVIASIALWQPVQAGSRGSGSRGGGGRSFSPAHNFSGSRGHFAGRSGNFSRGGPRFSGGSPRISSRGSAGYFRGRSGNFSRGAGRSYPPSTRLSSGATFRNTGGSGSRLAVNGTTVRNQRGFNHGDRIIARRSGNWRRNWDRRRDHFWRGHRCRWVNNSWVIFATGFYPYGYGFGYPYGYGYGYYPYGSYYDSGYYGDGYAADEYSQEPGQSGYDSGNPDSEISRVQAALARQRYYRGTIDGSLGPATRNALRRYQREHGLEVTGQVDQSVMDSLGVR